ncbi:MAG: fibronectin type III domain-containing protein, partial [Bacteroidales bacterium]|nr:fibronectin type III domain-containing protein [Bacteroidales bacterium]
MIPAAVISQPACQVPLSPVLRSVSVNPGNGFTELKWSSSPSPGIAAYIVYTFKDGTGMVIDTIWDPAATSYIYASTASKYFSVSYVVAAHRVPDCTSPLSNPISSVFCSTAIDTCKKELKVSWNSYSDFPARVEGYELEYRTGGGSPVIIKNIDRTAVSYTLTGFTTGAEYCFVVRAILQGGNVSSSNRSCIVTKMQRPPDWINADYTNVSAEGRINLSFKNISTKDALDIIILSNDLAAELRGGFIYVMPAKDYEITHGTKWSDARQVKIFKLRYARPTDVFAILNTIKSNIGSVAV